MCPIPGHIAIDRKNLGCLGKGRGGEELGLFGEGKYYVPNSCPGHIAIDKKKLVCLQRSLDERFHFPFPSQLV